MNSFDKKLEVLQNQLAEERRLVSFDSYDMSIRQIYEMFSEGAISIPPEYQRQFVWRDERESELIESVMLGIPVPSLFMATNQDATWEIVDGVQRLSTVAHFVGTDLDIAKINRKAPLEIKGLEKLTALNGMTFSDLPKSNQMMFLTRPIRVTVLNDKSDTNVRFDLFERLNTGGILLTNQEIRNCIFRGPFNLDLKKFAKHPDFLTAVKLKESDQKNGMAEEYVLRYFAYLETHAEFEHSVKGFLNSYMKKHADVRLSKKKLDLFKTTFSFLAKAYPNGIKRGQSSITAANLYEALSVGLALAIQKNYKILPGILEELASDGYLKTITTGATNSKSMVEKRIFFVRDSFK